MPKGSLRKYLPSSHQLWNETQNTQYPEDIRADNCTSLEVKGIAPKKIPKNIFIVNRTHISQKKEKCAVLALG